MSIFWAAAAAVSLAAALAGGGAARLTAALLEGAGQGITVTVALAGALCLFSGAAEVLEACGANRLLARLLRPLLGRIFPQASGDEEAMGCLCGNFTANLLGLGNAATPLGIRTVQRLRTLSGGREATDEMCRFIVLNTASVQLFPATVIALRAGAGARDPAEILPAVWLTSLVSVTVGLTAAYLFAGRRRRG